MAQKAQGGMAIELRKLMEDEKVVIGTERTQKMLVQRKLARVMITRNCPVHVRDAVARWCSTGQVELVELLQTNEELGVLCRKPYAISLLGIVA